MRRQLQNLGLNPKEITTYLTLLELGESSIAKIASRANVKRTSIYNFIDHLISLGLIGRSVKKGRSTYYAHNPERLISLQEERTQALKEVLPKLSKLYNSRTNPVSISYLDGPRQMRSLMHEELNCIKEVLYIWPARDVVESLGGIKYLEQLDKERIRKGISVKSVHFPNKQVQFETWEARKEFLREVRSAPKDFETTMGVSIYDTKKVGFFSSTKDAFGLLIESEELWVLMKGLFSVLWQTSRKS